MILVLTDETWGRVADALPPELLAELLEAPALPEPAELHRMARNDEVPAAVARAAELRRAGIEAAATTRARTDELLRQCYDLGVGGAVLSRWFELAPRLVYKALNRTTVAS